MKTRANKKSYYCLCACVACLFFLTVGFEGKAEESNSMCPGAAMAAMDMLQKEKAVLDTTVDHGVWKDVAQALEKDGWTIKSAEKSGTQVKIHAERTESKAIAKVSEKEGVIGTWEQLDDGTYRQTIILDEKDKKYKVENYYDAQGAPIDGKSTLHRMPVD